VIALQLLVAAIVTVGGVLLVLTLGILINKAVREARDRADRKRRERLEPPLLAIIHAERDVDEEGEPHRYRFDLAFGSLDAPDQRVIETVLADHAIRLEGLARERITHAFEDLGLVDRYLRGLGSRRWWRRADAAERLGLARSDRATEALTQRMTDVSGEVRLRAAKALGEIRGRAAVSPLVDALTKPNRWSTLRVADILSRMGAEAAEGVITAWPGLPKAARIASLDILGKIRRHEALTFLCGILKDGVSDERARAAHALGMIGHPAPIPDLIAAMSDPDWPVRAMAAKALGRIASPDAADPLSAGLKDKEWWVRSNSAIALKMLGPRGQQVLLDVLDESDNYARHQAVLMLQESGVLADSVAALQARDPLVQKQAETLVRKVIALGRIDCLSDMAREYPNFRVRVALDKLLEGDEA
jgi:HEAT repeat protein